tara:strand:- start:15 stop:1118 length:1104 start_codon:yes stop_codon:yes gene_type:complete
MALRLRGATSGYIELKAPASAGDNTLTLPTNNGGANQLLIIDGSGNLSWQSSLTFDAGLLKIDDLSGTAGKGRLEFGNSGEQFIEGYDTGNAGSGSYLTFGDGSTVRLRIKSGGEVRIGDNSTTASTAGDDLVIEGSSDRGLSIISGTSSSGNIYFGDSGDADIGRIAYQHNDNALDFSVNAGSTALRIENNKNVKINDGDLVIGTAGHGINFSAQTGTSATGAATTGDETLDHYEEGTWTPVANFGTSGSVTIAAAGHFTRVGRVVNICWTFYTTGLSSPSGDFTLTGLPFSCLDNTSSRFGVSFAFLREWNTDMPNLKGLISGGTTMYFYKHATTSAGSTQVQGSDFASGSSDNYIYGSATYMSA